MDQRSPQFPLLITMTTLFSQGCCLRLWLLASLRLVIHPEDLQSVSAGEKHSSCPAPSFRGKPAKKISASAHAIWIQPGVRFHFGRTHSTRLKHDPKRGPQTLQPDQFQNSKLISTVVVFIGNMLSACRDFGAIPAVFN